MWASIISFLLPVLEPLGTWLINKFIANQNQKQQYLAQYQAWIQAHKGDGQVSAAENQGYQNQVNTLNQQSQGGAPNEGNSGTQSPPVQNKPGN